MEERDDCNNLRINKSSSVGTTLDFMSYPMRKDVDQFRGYEKYGLWNIGTF